MKALILSFILLLAATGCVTTDGNPHAEADPQDQQSKWVNRGYNGGYFGTYAYVNVVRPKLDDEQRGHVREVAIAIDQICVEYMQSDRSGGEVISLNLLDLVMARVSKPAEPIAQKMVARVIREMQNRGLYLSALDDADRWEVVLAMRRGVADALRENGIHLYEEQQE